MKITKFINTATLKIRDHPPISAQTTFLVVKTVDLSIVTQIIQYDCNCLVYKIEIVNKGPSKATGIILNDILPPNTICSYIKLTQGTYKCFKNKITCYLGELDYNSHAVVIINIIPNCTKTLINCAFVSSNEYDINNNNNFFITKTYFKYYPNKSLPFIWIILILIYNQ